MLFVLMSTMQSHKCANCRVVVFTKCEIFHITTDFFSVKYLSVCDDWQDIIWLGVAWHLKIFNARLISLWPTEDGAELHSSRIVQLLKCKCRKFTLNNF